MPSRIFHIEIYRISLPFGVVSGDGDFWKHADEQAIDPDTYDLLYRNGLRTAVARQADWEHFRDLIDQYHTDVRRISFTSLGRHTTELEMKQSIPFQNIFYLDSTGQVAGRSFRDSDNLLQLTFEPVPRREGAARFVLCPLVRSTRQRLTYTATHRERGEIQFIHPEHLYELNLRVEVPGEHFLIVAPSTAGRWPTSLGHAFLIDDAPAERHEHLLIIVPNLLPVEP